VKGEREKLGSDSEELSDEPCFRYNIALCYPSDSDLADHAHRFDSFESSPSTSKGAVAFGQPAVGNARLAPYVAYQQLWH
jgi:hypothetical protein